MHSNCAILHTGMLMPHCWAPVTARYTCIERKTRPVHNVVDTAQSPAARTSYDQVRLLQPCTSTTQPSSRLPRERQRLQLVHVWRLSGQAPCKRQRRPRLDWRQRRQ